MPHQLSFRDFTREIGNEFKPLRKPVNGIVNAIQHDISAVGDGVNSALKRGGSLLDAFTNPAVLIGILLVGGIIVLRK